MAKIQIKSDPIISFGGIFSIMGSFDALLSGIIDSTWVLRTKTYSYQYTVKYFVLLCTCSFI